MAKLSLNRYSHLFICLIIAILAWLAVQMSDTHKQIYPFKIQFINLPEGKYISYQSDTIVDITFNASGIKLLPIEFKRKILNIDLTQIAYKKDNKNNISINKSAIVEYMTQQGYPSDDIDIANIKNITIKLESITDE